MASLPYEKTTISEQTSMTKIQMELEEIGLNQSAIIRQPKRKAVVVQNSGAEFLFEVDIELVVESLIKNSSTRRKQNIRLKNQEGPRVLDEMYGQAARIGWRHLAWQVKTICDGIKLGVLSPMQAFAGYLQLAGPNGSRKPMAMHLTELVNNGQAISPRTVMPLMLEDKT